MLTMVFVGIVSRMPCWDPLTPHPNLEHREHGEVGLLAQDGGHGGNRNARAVGWRLSWFEASVVSALAPPASVPQCLKVPFSCVHLQTSEFEQKATKETKSLETPRPL